ncbi:unnamed protein product [Amoebophrya sp. A120]|nr:unnamed protein product [Amoebophrya sp. A120]|eukprot:GSA120T00015353001.1
MFIGDEAHAHGWVDEIFVEEGNAFDPATPLFGDDKERTNSLIPVPVTLQEEKLQPENEDSVCLLLLPDELLFRIALFCSSASLCALACTCDVWRCCVQDFGHLILRGQALGDPVRTLEADIVQRLVTRSEGLISEREAWHIWCQRRALWRHGSRYLRSLSTDLVRTQACAVVEGRGGLPVPLHRCPDVMRRTSTPATRSRDTFLGWHTETGREGNVKNLSYVEQLRLPVWSPRVVAGHHPGRSSCISGRSAFCATCLHSCVWPLVNVIIVGSNEGTLRVYGQVLFGASAGARPTRKSSETPAQFGATPSRFSLEENLGHGPHQELCQLASAHRSSVTGIASARSLLLTVGLDGLFRVWRLERGVGELKQEVNTRTASPSAAVEAARTPAGSAFQCFRLLEIFQCPLSGGPANRLSIISYIDGDAHALDDDGTSGFIALTAHEDGSVRAHVGKVVQGADPQELHLQRHRHQPSDVPLRRLLATVSRDSMTIDSTTAASGACFDPCERVSEEQTGNRLSLNASPVVCGLDRLRCLEAERIRRLRLWEQEPEESQSGRACQRTAPAVFYDWCLPFSAETHADLWLLPELPEHRDRATFEDVLQLDLHSIRVPAPTTAAGGSTEDQSGPHPVALSSGRKLLSQSRASAIGGKSTDNASVFKSKCCGDVRYPGVTGERTPIISPSGAPPMYVCTHLEGNLVCSGGFDRKLHVWDVWKNSQHHLSFSTNAHIVALHAVRAKALFVGLSSGLILQFPWGQLVPHTTLVERTSAVCDEVIELRGHAGSVEDICALEGSRLLVSASADGYLRFWNVDTTASERHKAALAVIDLQRPVLQVRFVFGAVYRKSCGAGRVGGLDRVTNNAGRSSRSASTCAASYSGTNSIWPPAILYRCVDGEDLVGDRGDTVAKVRGMQARSDRNTRDSTSAGVHTPPKYGDVRLDPQLLVLPKSDARSHVLTAQACPPPYEIFAADIEKVLGEFRSRTNARRRLVMGTASTAVPQVHSLPCTTAARARGSFDRSRKKSLPMLGSTGKQHRQYLAT